MSAPIPLDLWFGAWLVIALLVVVVSGVLFETGAASAVLGWVTGAVARQPHGVATASHRG